MTFKHRRQANTAMPMFVPDRLRQKCTYGNMVENEFLLLVQENYFTYMEKPTRFTTGLSGWIAIWGSSEELYGFTIFLIGGRLKT